MSTRLQLREAQRRRSHRTRALLAAGAVLGVGAAATLAAWNDSEYASSSFTAGIFGIEGSVNGTTFLEHPAGNPAALTFSTGFDALAPGTTVYALFSVRSVEDSVAGTVQLAADASNSGGLGQWLTYSVRTIAGTACNAGTFQGGTQTGLPQGQPLTVGATAAQALAADQGGSVNYCFAVTLPNDAASAAQGTALDAAWVFQGASS